MREDKTVDKQALQNSKALTGGKGIYDYTLSFSGNERNHLFLNQAGKQFVEVSSVSGIDHDGDSRSFAKLDYNRDGRVDVLLTNNNAPLVQLFRNCLDETPDNKNSFVAFRLVGGNQTSQPSSEWSNRDGIGGSIRMTVNGLPVIREHRAGEGLCAQNSSTILIGIGTDEVAKDVEIQWPSGKTQSLGNIKKDSLVTVYENPEHSPAEVPFVVEPYSKKRIADSRDASSGLARRKLAIPEDETANTKIRVYTTMASWCPVCAAEVPKLDYLKNEFGDDIDLIAIPIDDDDGQKEIAAFIDQHQPPYRVRKLSKNEFDKFSMMVEDELGSFGAPVAVVTDGSSNVLGIEWGPPSVSEIKRLINTVIPKAESP